MAQLQEFRGAEGTDFFAEDKGFQRLLADLLATHEQGPLFAMLHECGRRAAGPWDRLAKEASRAENLPRILKYDRVGNPVEQVDFGEYTRQLRRQTAEFGLFTKAANNLHKFAMIYYSAHNGEASINCGVSCTDGLIRAIEAKGSPFLRETYLPKLYSSETPFAGAQFVTERAGGSDVGATESYAVANGDGTWSLTGDKWFCSNPDEYFLVGAKADRGAKGTAGVAVFLVPRLLPDGRPNAISFQRLKDKLGTRSLPTAEMKFEGALAYPIGDVKDGFKTLMNYIINVSRIHNAINACAFSHRAFLEARNYARQRESFGMTLIESPLVRETLVKLLARTWRNRLLTFRLIAMVDQNGLVPENGEQAMWQRFLTNLAKYRTALTLVDSMREAMLILGGNGIVEDFTILPRLFRDAMIIETWEGPPNTLCLQIVRDAARSNLFERFQTEMRAALESWDNDFLFYTRVRFHSELERFITSLEENAATVAWVEANTRRLVDTMGRLVEIAWMAEFARRHRDEDATAALLTSFSGWEVFDNCASGHPLDEVLGGHSAALVDEEICRADVANL